MKTRKLALSLFFASLFVTSNAKISSPIVEKDFEKRVESVNNPGYFEIFSRDLPKEKIEALKVLYAYMPLPDIADNSGDFFLENVNYTLKAREEMPWGKIVPEREFRHFVLPVRINNEYLDGYRKVFYEELKDRVRNLSMKDAILEINHWCHEKATYQPSDGRTHSPLATVYTAIGRCGEESTFTVAALRSMGIPARQIYTPRWAHTDDNHAWVEAWADGKWYFLGACEPEPVLNLGWFNAPASRGMMMNTRVPGNYDGPEEVLSRPVGYTEINVTSNYAPVDTITVVVKDTKGNPVKDASISFNIYNYAEFYPITYKKTDSFGKASLTAGLGDIIAWATDGKNFGFTKGSVGKENEITLVLDKTPDYEGVLEFNITPPAPSGKTVDVTPEQVAENDARKAYEDSLRGAYEATFLNAEQSAAIAAGLGVDPARLTAIMTDARGNHAVIRSFLEQTDNLGKAMDLLESISVKDRSDISLPVLQDQMSAEGQGSEYFKNYILNPRVSDENLTTFRSYFRNNVDAATLTAYKDNPEILVEEVAKNITIVPDWYPGNLNMSPEAVHKSKITNAKSRDTYFVKLARSAGIPAYIDAVTGKVKWIDNSGNIKDAVFRSEQPTAAKNATGKLQLSYEKTGRIDNPRYYSHFTISKINNGFPKLLEYPENGTWKSIFENPADIDAGQYILISGQRMADGGVLARTAVLKVDAGKTKTDSLVMRQDNEGVQVIGNFNSENIYHDIETNSDKSVLSTTGRGYFVIGIISPNQEPTNHALRDIAALKSDFEKWNRSIILLFKDKEDYSRFDKNSFPELPSTVSFGTDIDNRIAKEITESLKLNTSDRPVFIIGDTFNRVIFVSQGYTIGLGEQLIKTIHKLKE